jgi:hypothetical protein
MTRETGSRTHVTDRPRDVTAHHSSTLAEWHDKVKGLTRVGLEIQTIRLEGPQTLDPLVLLPQSPLEVGAVLKGQKGEVGTPTSTIEVLGHGSGPEGGDVAQVLLHPSSQRARGLSNVTYGAKLAKNKINHIYRLA